MRFLTSSLAAVMVVAALGVASLARAEGEKAEKRERPFLGISIVANAERSTKGIVVGGILKGTAAEQAGLKKGDIIRKLGDKEVDGAKQFMELLQKLSPGDEVALLVERDGWQKTIKAKLGKRPADDDDDDDDGPSKSGHHDEGHGESR
jgi:S1-C subfamily serine protease